MSSPQFRRSFSTSAVKHNAHQLQLSHAPLKRSRPPKPRRFRVEGKAFKNLVLKNRLQQRVLRSIVPLYHSLSYPSVHALNNLSTHAYPNPPSESTTEPNPSLGVVDQIVFGGKKPIPLNLNNLLEARDKRSRNQAFLSKEGNLDKVWKAVTGERGSETKSNDTLRTRRVDDIPGTSNPRNNYDIMLDLGMKTKEASPSTEQIQTTVIQDYLTSKLAGGRKDHDDVKPHDITPTSSPQSLIQSPKNQSQSIHHSTAPTSFSADYQIVESIEGSFEYSRMKKVLDELHGTEGSGRAGAPAVQDRIRLETQTDANLQFKDRRLKDVMSKLGVDKRFERLTQELKDREERELKDREKSAEKERLAKEEAEEREAKGFDDVQELSDEQESEVSEVTKKSQYTGESVPL